MHINVILIKEGTLIGKQLKMCHHKCPSAYRHYFNVLISITDFNFTFP
jgi:hypothetical protein